MSNHRLIRLSLMDARAFEGILTQLSKQGRVILKSIEQYQFTLNQSINMLANDKVLAKKLEGQQNQIKQAMSVIYNTVFNVENMDIMELYEQQSSADVENNDEIDNDFNPLDAEKPTQNFKNDDAQMKDEQSNDEQSNDEQSNDDDENEQDDIEDEADDEGEDDEVEIDE